MILPGTASRIGNGSNTIIAGRYGRSCSQARPVGVHAEGNTDFSLIDRPQLKRPEPQKEKEQPKQSGSQERGPRRRQNGVQGGSQQRYGGSQRAYQPRSEGQSRQTRNSRGNFSGNGSYGAGDRKDISERSRVQERPAEATSDAYRDETTFEGAAAPSAADADEEVGAAASGQAQAFLASPSGQQREAPAPAPAMTGPPSRRTTPQARQPSQGVLQPDRKRSRDQPDRGPRRQTNERNGAQRSAMAPRQQAMAPRQQEATPPAAEAATVTESDAELTDVEEAPTDVDEPLLNAKPTMRRPAPKKEKQGPPFKDDVRAFRRLGPEKKMNDPPKAVRSDTEQRSQGYRPKRFSGNGASPQGQQDSGGRGGRRDRGGGRRKQAAAPAEKQDIERQRATRQERRQQRQEQLKASAREQEEIFEVGSEGMSVGDLADKLAINGGDVLKTLFLNGIMAQVNQVLDKQMVKLVAEEYEVEVLDLEEAGLDSLARKTAEYSDDADLEFLTPRPPVVTVMGHVDHGKTSLLDYMRKTKVAAGEAGGITQAIGAYTVDVESSSTGPKHITFLDTPGHEAFSAMRARGARVTDIAIVVVACDDGVRPQTREAISHAKAAKVPIIVALNKIDKEGANIERAKQEMNEAGLLPEEWGGDTPFVAISAKKGTGIDSLLETVLLVAELGELTANAARRARGSVVEAHLDRRSGPVATMLVATGTLRVGDCISAGASYGKVRSMVDSRGASVDEAGPSIPVQVVGLNGVPIAGDEFAALESEQEARKVASAIEESQRTSRLAEQAGGSMVTGMTLATYDEDEDALQHFNIVLKADASGSVEAIKATLLGLPQDRVALRFLMAATGEITSGDVQLAHTSQGQVIGFNLEPSEAVQALAKQYGIEIKTYKVIYELISDIRDIMEGRLGAIEERTPIGEAEVRAVFGSGSKKVAGCIVNEGALRKGCLIVVTRKNRTVHEGRMSSLRRIKENVSEVTSGNECGLGVDGFIEWREGDRLQAFDVTAKRQTLEEASQSLASNSAAGQQQSED